MLESVVYKYSAYVQCALIPGELHINAPFVKLWCLNICNVYYTTSGFVSVCTVYT